MKTILYISSAILALYLLRLSLFSGLSQLK